MLNWWSKVSLWLCFEDVNQQTLLKSILTTNGPKLVNIVASQDQQKVVNNVLTRLLPGLLTQELRTLKVTTLADGSVKFHMLFPLTSTKYIEAGNKNEQLKSWLKFFLFQAFQVSISPYLLTSTLIGMQPGEVPDMPTENAEFQLLEVQTTEDLYREPYPDKPEDYSVPEVSVMMDEGIPGEEILNLF
ncbi:ORF7 [Frog adenovirus 1]|uniref:ORF7 n=1 Tax=Frog adenovirus 1 (strain ATCC VR-896) TaxID=114102 RepID=Q9IIG5_ADEF1|nr:ORF7 [Frog adenovirus 1]AAF86942.1 ORF7 [Frog adenovirus 1]